MFDYFKPIRRKLGVITLVMACLFATAWLRSLTCIDLVGIPGRTVNYFVISAAQEFGIISAASSNLRIGARGLYDVKLITAPSGYPVGPRKFIWKSFPEPCTRAGIFVMRDDQYSSPDDDEPIVKMIPYWSIVIPLTLFSAWLLLSKPQARQPARGQMVGL